MQTCKCIYGLRKPLLILRPSGHSLIFIGVIHIMTSTLRGMGVRQKWDVIGGREGEGWGWRCTRRRIFFFFIRENWICATSRHHTEPKHWHIIDKKPSFRLPLHCLWAKSNNRARGQCECDVTWFIFLFCICSLTCTVQLLFHSLFTFSRCSNKIGWLQNEY